MEIQAWLFISFWAIMSITFLHLGFHALDKTELSTSVSPVVMFLFKHSLAASSCFSSSYALKFRAQSIYAVRSNFVLLVYVLFSFIFPRTIEGILIWHVLKAIFGWLLYFLLKLKIFFGMIFRFPTFLFLSIFRFLRKIIPVIAVIILVLLLYYIPPSLILSIIYVAAGRIILYLFISLFHYIVAYAPSWLFSHVEFLCVPLFTFLGKGFSWLFSHVEFLLVPLLTFLGKGFSWLFSHVEFLWVPLFTFLGICFAIFFIVVCLVGLCILVYQLILACKNNFSELKTRAGILLVLEISLFFVSANEINFSPILVLSISHLISVCWAAYSRFGDYALVSGDPLWDGQSVEGLVRIAVKVVALEMKEVVSRLNEHKAKKFIEFAVGTMGAVLFQNFFRITSFSEVAAFLSFTVAWLANLVLLGFCGDFGIFNFLLANVVVGCTVGQFGLHSATWLALGAALLLFGVRLKLESIAIAYREGQLIQLSFFGDESVALPHHLPL